MKLVEHDDPSFKTLALCRDFGVSAMQQIQDSNIARHLRKAVPHSPLMDWQASRCVLQVLQLHKCDFFRNLTQRFSASHINAWSFINSVFGMTKG